MILPEMILRLLDLRRTWSGEGKIKGGKIISSRRLEIGSEFANGSSESAAPARDAPVGELRTALKGGSYGCD